MKNSFYIICLLFLLGFSKLEKTRVIITDKSEIVIKGQSNVNRFQCHYNQDLVHSEITVTHFTKNQTTFLNNAIIEIKSEGFDCAHKMITRDLKSVLKSHEYSNIVVVINEIIETNTGMIAKVIIEIAGVEKKYTFPVIFDANENNVKGELKIDIKDFKLKAPKKILGLIKLNEEVAINFNLFLEY